jgi:uncharacterized protein with FMN-binding domain
MKRAPIVIAGTVAGLVGVLEFHTSPAELTTSAGSALPAASAAPAASSLPRSGSAATVSPAAAPSASTSTSAGAGSSGAADRTAVGPAVNYTYGVLSVQVTVSGSKIIKVSIASLSDNGNPKSELIDDQSIPILEQEALQAQSANIQAVSGASFTSAGFTQSLQGALRSLGVA